jgi:hypothetical protein
MAQALLHATESMMQFEQYCADKGGELIATRIGTDCGPCPLFVIAVVPERDQISGLEAMRDQIAKRINMLKAAKAAGGN